MEWTQTIAIMSTLVTVFALLSGLMIFLFSKLDGDINNLSRRLDGHATRIDQLYRMFIDIVDKK